MEAGDLSQYQAAHNRIAKLPRIMAKLTLLMEGKNGLRARVLRALAAEPILFERMLAIHIGEFRFSEFALQGPMSLGWHLISA